MNLKIDDKKIKLQIKLFNCYLFVFIELVAVIYVLELQNHVMLVRNNLQKFVML